MDGTVGPITIAIAENARLICISANFVEAGSLR